LGSALVSVIGDLDVAGGRESSEPEPHQCCLQKAISVSLLDGARPLFPRRGCRQGDAWSRWGRDRRCLRGCLVRLLRHLNFVSVAQPEVGSGAGFRAIHHPLTGLAAGRVAASDLDVGKV